MATELDGAQHEPGRLQPSGDAIVLRAGGDEPQATEGIGPYRLAMRRLRRNRVGLAFGLLFVLVVASSLAAPLYARHIAHTGPNDNHITDTVKIGGPSHDVVSVTGIPIGPTWHSHFLLGADANGRDIAVRLLYGGRNSLEIGLLGATI